jgi:hypothetical protein
MGPPESFRAPRTVHASGYKKARPRRATRRPILRGARSEVGRRTKSSCPEQTSGKRRDSADPGESGLLEKALATASANSHRCCRVEGSEQKEVSEPTPSLYDTAPSSWCSFERACIRGSRPVGSKWPAQVGPVGQSPAVVLGRPVPCRRIDRKRSANLAPSSIRGEPSLSSMGRTSTIQ